MFTMISFHDDARDRTWNWKLGSEFPFDGAFNNDAKIRIIADGKELEFVRQHFDNVRMARGTNNVVFNGEDARFIGSNMKFVVWENTSVLYDSKVAACEKAINDYHAALDRRQHGDVATHACVSAIEDALGMPWLQGQSLVKKES